ncbi:DUF3597 domain-containing protein [Cupriavidus plantarum]|uniref:DUF3597 domain-containing protein n=1 Tax=Cupriavidus plantarum TaxID=942865 RepID=UPI000EB02AF0|nr:DUF3597 domain-containing protein [Cupriavidus plantarum]RLK45190.1 uncharacterized protein DUF3597 [Cupriavidus plantarum]CAG2128998.1 hypothetical protein LMG26296_01484 [Cupriavidus plantarum]SMR66382.1 protein of unknown function [Cupriavidus plantarum]
MSIFKDILNKLLHRGGQQTGASTGGTATAGASTAPGAQAAPTAAPTAPSGGNQPATGGASGTPGAASPAPLSQVDVEAVMDKAAKEAGQPLNWRTSIVDLLKALGIDSSLDHRKELAKELGYTGDTNDSAAMNMWLHKRVMQELARNGGKLPKDLTD